MLDRHRAGPDERGRLAGCGTLGGACGGCGGLIGAGGVGKVKLEVCVSLELLENVFHPLFEVGTYLLEHLISMDWRWSSSLHVRLNRRLWRFRWRRSLWSWY